MSTEQVLERRSELDFAPVLERGSDPLSQLLPAADTLFCSQHEGPPHEHRGPADFDGTKPKGKAGAASAAPVQGSSSGAGRKDTGDEDEDDDDDVGGEGSEFDDVKVEDSRSVKDEGPSVRPILGEARDAC